MLLSATLVLLGFWLTIVWYFDIDGFRRQRRREDHLPREETPRSRIRAEGS